MSNKKELSQISASEAKKLSVSALAVRPNDASRFGQGGLSAAALQEWFDKLPNLVKDKFNEIARTLASPEASKYIGIDALGADNLYDFLALFGERGVGIEDKNIADYIQVLYAAENESQETSRTLPEVIADLISRLSTIRADMDNSYYDAYLDGRDLVLVTGDADEKRVDLSSLAFDEGARKDIETLKNTVSVLPTLEQDIKNTVDDISGISQNIEDLYTRLEALEGEDIVPFLEQLYEGGIE